MLAVALLLLVPFACLLAPVENASGLATASGAAQAARYSYENLYAQDTVFNNHVLSYTLSGQVTDMATGDLNSDGLTDVVVATSTKLTIFYGRAGGALGEPFSPALAMSEIRKIAVGDINSDGRDDIAVTYGGSAHGAGRVALFYQEEDGSTVRSSYQIATDDDPWQVVIGDFSGSGSNGLAVICRGDQSAGDVATVMILRHPYSIPYDSRHIELPYGLTNLKLLAAGYVDADQRMDLVAGDAYGGTIVIMTQPTTFSNQWTQSTRSIGGFISDIRFMDYSGSGSPRDLIVVKSGQSSDQVEIRVNSGGIPTSASGSITVSGASTVATGRVTGSSYSDLVVLSNYENRARLYPGRSGGLDRNEYDEWPVNSGPIKAVAVNGGVYILSSGNSGVIEYYRYLDSRISNADGNRLVTDGQPTVVCAGSGPYGIMAAIYDGLNAVYVSDLSGTGGRVIPTTSVPTDLYIGDLDGDGAEDLAIAFRSSNSISVYRGSSGSFTDVPVTISLSLSQPRSMTGGTIDAIGKKILVVGCTGGIDIIYDPLSGSPTHEVIGTDNPAARIDVALGRFGQAGSEGGIAALGYNQDFIELYYVKQPPRTGDCYDTVASAKLTSSATFTSITVGDINDDGKDDIAAIAASRLIVFSNAGSSDGPRTYALPESSSPIQVRSADLNDDGRDDLVIRYSAQAIMSIWLSKGTFEFSNLFNVTAGGAASGMFLGDINGDGRADILASSSTSSAISYWLQRDLLPSASAWLSSLAIDVNDTIRVDAANSTDSFSDRAASLIYRWDFGDGNTSTGKVAQHTYSAAGTYYGNLQVTDRSGLTGRADFVVRVNNPVKADFDMTKYTVTVGEEFFVWDKSDVPNHLKSISWDLGNGEVKNGINEFYYKYTRPGTYNITLRITDMMDKVSSKVRTITVLSASGTIDGIVANGGKTTFDMDQEIHFEVIVNASRPITEFSWDMDHNIVTRVFNQTPGRSINQTTWTYTTPGEHTVCVRFYDLELTEKTLTIYIINPRPVAVVTATLSKPSNFTFDASKSYDTPTDIKAGLEYRWHFDDGSIWTEWTRDPKVVHHYEVTESRVFNVTLEVRDQWGLVNSTIYKAIVDFDEPIIDLDRTMISQAYRGEDLVIKVNVTDLSNVVQVLLVYTSNNETKTLVMSRISGTNTYVATIPAMDVTGSLSYYIKAMDSDGRWATSAIMGVTLVDRPDALWVYLIVIIGAAAGGAFLLFYYRSRMVVDDVFIIYQDGNLMAHQTRRLKPVMDDQILGSMLVAIQEFVKDSFKDEASTGLNRMDFGEKKVLVEKGEHIYLAVVLHGKREGRVPQRMREAISRAERDYLEALQEWDGDMEKVRGIKDETDPLLRPGLRDIVSSIPFLGKEEAGPVEMTVCPYCENAHPATDAKCPKCGTVPDDKASGEQDRPGRQAA